MREKKSHQALLEVEGEKIEVEGEKREVAVEVLQETMVVKLLSQRTQAGSPHFVKILYKICYHLAPSPSSLPSLTFLHQSVPVPVAAIFRG